MPFTSLWIGSKRSKRSDIPWVGELRDLWVTSPYYDYPLWRKKIERVFERRVLTNVDGLVTVSEPLAKILRTENDAPGQKTRILIGAITVSRGGDVRTRGKVLGNRCGNSHGLELTIDRLGVRHARPLKNRP